MPSRAPFKQGINPFATGHVTGKRVGNTSTVSGGSERGSNHFFSTFPQTPYASILSRTKRSQQEPVISVVIRGKEDVLETSTSQGGISGRADQPWKFVVTEGSYIRSDAT